MSETSLTPIMKEAVATHRQGFPTRAIPLYESVLAESPDDAQALSLYGLALVQAGRPSEAEKPLKRAIELDPAQPSFKANLAEMFLKIGDVETGIAELTEVTAKHPEFAPAFVRLGHLRLERQELREAADAFDAALELRPDDLTIAHNLAWALSAVGNYGAAYHVLDHAEKIMPDNVNTLKIRLEIARFRRDFSAMHALATQLTKLEPENPVGWRSLATTLYESGIFADAVLAFEKALTLTGRDAESLSQLASLAIQALDFNKAEAALAEAEKLAPHHARMLSTKALLLTYQGKRKEAEEYCERCFRADPEFVSVFPQLSLLRGGKLTEEEERKISAYADRSDIISGARATARFVIAHNLEARGDIDAAFQQYQRANEAAAQRNVEDMIAYDHVGHSAWTNEIIKMFANSPNPREQSYHEGPEPIFIVGLPRCGSTLVESVIAAHSKVRPGGEMPMMPNIFNSWFRANYQLGPGALSDDECARLAKAYMDGLQPAITNERFTDKNLLNIEASGLIARIFPNAKIVNIRRNPVENAFAIWRQDMMKFWSFATDFEALAQRYALYARLVEHFENVLPQFTTIQYEDFVTDFPERSRQLIAFCGLNWEEGCGDFQKARDIAPTISAVQIREEVSLKGDRSALYGARLDPLREALEAAGVDLKTGTLKR